MISKNGYLGRSHSTFEKPLTNSLFSGYSSPVSTKTAGMSAHTRLTKSKSTVESLPPEKLTNTFPPNLLYHSIILACVTIIFLSKGHDCIIFKSSLVFLLIVIPRNHRNNRVGVRILQMHICGIVNKVAKTDNILPPQYFRTYACV